MAIIIFEPEQAAKVRKTTRTKFEPATTIDLQTGSITWELGMSEGEAEFIAEGLGHKVPQTERYMAVKRAIRRNVSRKNSATDAIFQHESKGMGVSLFGDISALLTAWQNNTNQIVRKK